MLLSFCLLKLYQFPIHLSMKTIHSLQILFRCSTYRTISVYASCITYYTILSTVPALMLLLSLSDAVGFFSLIAAYLPNSLSETIHNVITVSTEHANFSIRSVSMAAWIWSASKSIAATMDGMNAALRISHKPSFFYKRLLAILYIIVLSICSNLTLLLIVFGIHILSLLQSRFPVIPDFIFTIVHFRAFTAVLFLTCLISIMYKLHPSTNIAFRFCLLGGLFTAIGWSVLSFFFSIYVNYFAQKYLLFGELGALLLFAIWLRACIILFLIGMKLSYLRQSKQQPVICYTMKLFRSIYE